ncbi:MAG: glycosyltransferase family 8 protein [Planctomycetaceae bacterium]|jgi:lipopolysaccharide biosynthesis glycosyltransferase|nr:glycosyltransferase family 8 protein [Planctomycetaceae bacterium]
MIDVAIASDWNYLPHAGTLIRSLCDNNRNNDLRIHLLTMDSRVVDDELLGRFFGSIVSDRVSAKVHFVDANNPFITRIPKDGAITNKSAYLRFLASDLIEADKVLYLDSDIVVLDDLGSLFETELSGRMLAAVTDIFVCPSSWNYSLSLRYFNSGVLLINAKKWREENWFDRTLRFMCDKFVPMRMGLRHYGDQDILNMTMAGKVVYVHPRYNMVNPFFLRRSFFRGKIFDEASLKPAIIHFAGGAKPWNQWDFHPMSECYYFYRKRTPWTEFAVQKPTIRAVRRYAAFLLKYYCPYLIYPFSELAQILKGLPSRCINSEQIEWLMQETSQNQIR